MQHTKSDAGYPDIRLAWYILAVLALAAVVSHIDRMILSLVVEPIKSDLGLSDIEISLLQGFSFAIFFSLAGVPLARLADRKNRIYLVAGGMVLWSIMTAACGLATNFTELFIARVGVGIGEAALIPATISLMPDLFPKRFLGRANALFAVGAGMGTGLAMLVGGWLLLTLAPLDFSEWGDRFNQPWRLLFMIVGIPGPILAVILLVTVREPKRLAPQAAVQTRMDWQVLRDFAGANTKTLVTMIFGFLTASMVFSGWLAWTPTFLVRTYGIPITEAASQLGFVVLGFGLLGNLCGGFMADYLFGKGYKDASFRMAVLIMLLMAVCASIAAHMPSSMAAVAFIGPLFFLGACLSVLPPLSFQLMTPAPILSQVFALFQLLVVGVSYGLGPTLVAFVNEHVVSDGGKLGQALFVVSLLGLIPSAFALWIGASAFRKSLDATETRQASETR